MRDLPISLRGYLAAHAPAAPEPWFEVKFDHPEPKPVSDAKWCDGCKAGGECDGDADCEYLSAMRDLRDEWKQLRDKAIAVQWRWAWADAMLEAGGTDMRTEALKDFVATVTATGGVLKSENGICGCVADPDWMDLADAYLTACEALGIEPVTKSEEEAE